MNAHFEDFIFDSYDMSDSFNGKFWQLWKDVATFFAYAPQSKLILEILNEPHGVLGDWSGGADPRSARAIELTRRILKAGRDGVRSVDGDRIVQVSTNGLGNIGSLSWMYPTPSTLPGGGTDRFLQVHVHSYDQVRTKSQSFTTHHSMHVYLHELLSLIYSPFLLCSGTYVGRTAI